MPASLHLPTVLSKLAEGQRVIPVNPGTVRDALAAVASQYPALAPRIRDDHGEPHAFLNVFLNDEDIRFNGGLDAAIKDGDEITLVPAIAGG